jgi:hypothetical protein
MNKKVISKILQAPFILLGITSFFASIYAAIKQIGGVTFATPVIIGLILVLYFYGRHLETKFKGVFKQ